MRCGIPATSDKVKKKLVRERRRSASPLQIKMATLSARAHHPWTESADESILLLSLGRFFCCIQPAFRQWLFPLDQSSTFFWANCYDFDSLVCFFFRRPLRSKSCRPTSKSRFLASFSFFYCWKYVCIDISTFRLENVCSGTFRYLLHSPPLLRWFIRTVYCFDFIQRMSQPPQGLNNSKRPLESHHR